MVRFCDKEVYVIHVGEMSRSQMLMFFLNQNGEHRFDVIMVLDEDDKYYGVITYQRLLKCKDDSMVVNRDIIKITDSFWQDVREYFVRYPKELLPVADIDGNILGFCYNDNALYNNIFRYLKTFEERYENLPVPFEKCYKSCQAVCITDLNELAWECRHLFRKMGYPVIVLGEKWEWFGIKSMEGYYD